MLDGNSSEKTKAKAGVDYKKLIEEIEENSNIQIIVKAKIDEAMIELLNDLLDLPIKSMQIELIKDNPLNANIEFLNKLFYKYQFYNFTSHIKENVDDLIKNLEKHFKNKATIDLFLINHEN